MKVELPFEVDHGPGNACWGVEGRKQLLSQLNCLHLKNLPDGQNKNKKTSTKAVKVNKNGSYKTHIVLSKLEQLLRASSLCVRTVS